MSSQPSKPDSAPNPGGDPALWLSLAAAAAPSVDAGNVTSLPATSQLSGVHGDQSGAHPHSPAAGLSELSKAQLEADRAGDHMNFTADQARAVNYRTGSLQMAQFAAAGQLYRQARHSLQNLLHRSGPGTSSP